MLTDTEVKTVLSAKGIEAESINIHRPTNLEENEAYNDMAMVTHYDNAAPSFRYIPALSDTLYIIFKTAAGTTHVQELSIRKQVECYFTLSNVFIEQEEDGSVFGVNIHLYKPLKELAKE